MWDYDVSTDNVPRDDRTTGMLIAVSARQAGVGTIWPVNRRGLNPAMRIPRWLGARIRRERLALGAPQQDVAAKVGVSQATFSRVEIGRGAGVPLKTWLRIGAALDLEWEISLRSRAEVERNAIQRRCHRLVARTAAAGGWSAWTSEVPADPTRTVTLLERPERGEAAVI